MTQPIYLHYTQAELDRNFDQRGWVTNAEEVIARYGPLSDATRARFKTKLDLRYGPSPDERLDLFLTDQPSAPILVFVHGGRWQMFTKDNNAFVADPIVPAGAHVAVLNFSKLPAVRLPDMVDQVRRGIEWVWRNAASFGGDANRLYVSGHSSGAHLAGMALATDWPARGLPADLIKGAALVSGPYDLEPVMLSWRSDYVKLAPDEVPAHSPTLLTERFRCPVIVGWADGDTDEFRRQSAVFAEHVRRAGHLVEAIHVPGQNHFEIMEQLGLPTSPIVQRLLRLMGLATG
ncbi:MAG: alpha/beta hydrolase [Burkholderiales bacterium]